MAEPSLSEITSIKGDAAIGAGANGLNISESNFDASLPYLQAAAASAMQADKLTLDQFNKNLESQLLRARSVDFAGVMPDDFKDLSQNYAGLLKNIADNYDVIRNPQKNLQKWAEINQAESQIRSGITRSKDSKLIYDEAKKFLDDHPIWNTPGNQQKLQSFLSLPVDQREPFQFDQPFNADIAKLAKAATAGATVQVSDAQVVDGGKYIRTTEGTVIDSEKYQEIIRASLNGTDEFSRSNREGYQKLLDLLPAQEQAKYTDLEDFVIKNADAYKGVNTTTKNTLNENRIYMQEDEQKFQASENAKNRSLEQQRIDLAKRAEKSGTIDKEAAGELKNQLLTSLFSTGQAPLSILQDIYGDNTEVEVSQDIMGDDTTFPKDGGGFEQKKVGETKTKKPLLTVIETKLDQKTGQLVVYRRNNQTGKQVPAIRVTPAQANSDLNNIAGRNNAVTISKASREYLKSRIGTEEFDLNKIREKNLFGFKDTGAAAPGVATSPKVTESPYKNLKFTMNGKAVSNDVLLKSYSNAEIQDFIDKGLLKTSK